MTTLQTPYIFRQSLLSASFLKNLVDINADGIAEVPASTDSFAGAVASPANTLATPGTADASTGIASPRAFMASPVVAADPHQSFAAQANTVVASAASQGAADGMTLDQEFLAKASAWSKYAMDQLSQVGNTGRVLGNQDLQNVNVIMTQAAHHLQMLGQEASERGAPETLKFIHDTLDNLGQASQIYAAIPGGQSMTSLRALQYQRQTMLDQQNQDMQANMRNQMRVGAVLNPNFQQGSGMPPFGMPGMGMPMGMPGMPMGMPGMPMPGMPMTGMPMTGMPMTGAYPNTMYPQQFGSNMFAGSVPMPYGTSTYPGQYPVSQYPSR